MFGSGFGASSSPFGGTSTFGQTPSQSPFGAAPPANVFGQQSQPAFGASPAPAFGASTPAFGATSTPAFGAASTAPSFGGSAFGAKPAGFGFGAPASSPAFGAASTSPFGAASAPAFGAASSAPGFGASPSPFGASAPAFGATSSPAFGAASTPAFGQTLAAFGSTAFGATPGGTAFGGGTGSAFGGAAVRGTRSTAYRKTQETDQSAAGKTTVNYSSISCMPEYSGKSAEELRWEDYEDGCKGNTGGGFGQQQQQLGGAASPFGASASPFGATSAPAFGAAASTPAFGVATPAFGAAPASSPGFGFGATSTPAFGAASSSPAFGASPSPFGAPASSSPFGAPSAPAFGAPSTPAFGGSPAPAFGTASSSPGFGASTFGAQASAPAFGGFGASSAPAFGATSAPAFGAPASSSAFGFGGATAAPAFGASSSAFSFAPPASAFGSAATSSPFGAPAASSASLFGATSAPAFGGTSLFGAAGAKPASTPFGAGGSLFGGASTPAFGATPSTGFGAPAAGGSFFGGTPLSTPAFGATSTAGGGLFGGGTAGGLFGSTPAFSSTPQLTAQTGALVPAQPVQPPTIGGSPYGMLPEAPKASPLPENKVGLTQQRLGGALLGGTPRPMALISPRSITPRSGVRMRSRRSLSAAASRLSKSPADFLVLPGMAEDGAVSNDGQGRAGSATPSANVFVPRDNPRRLFVRDQLPSTQDAAVITASPSLRAGLPPARDIRTPGTALRLTPLTAASGGNGRVIAREFEHHTSTPNGVSEEERAVQLTENGQAEDAGILSDAELARLLPTLTRQGYYTKPSLQQLAAMGREDPSALERVPQFTVGCRGVGSVTFLEPTDVRGLDLDAIVTLTKGSIEVYLEDGEKPEVGKGLNKAAVVTMERIHKIDKHTGKPTTDQEAIDRFSRKLKRVTADQGAAFVSYDPLAGEWKFQVEHFSRYGLVDSDDDEEAGGAEGGSDGELEGYGVRRLAAGAQQAQRPARLEADKGRQDGLRQESEGQPSASLAGDVHDEAMTPASGGGWKEHQDGLGAPSTRRALQVALPAQLGMDPEDLQRIRDNLFSSATRPSFQPPSLRHQRVIHVDLQQAQQEKDGGEGQYAPQVALVAAPSQAGAQQGTAGALAEGEPASKAPRSSSWHQRAQQALQAPGPPAAHGAGSCKGCAGVGTLPLLPSGPTPVSPVPLQRTAALCPFPAPRRPPTAADGPGEERCLPDAGLFLGASFRAGWTATAMLAFAGGRPSSAAHVAMRRVQPAPLPGKNQGGLEKLRARLEAFMRLHIQHSMPDAAGSVSDGDAEMHEEEGGEKKNVSTAPRWRLKCDRGEELRQLTLAYIQGCSEAAQQVEGLDRTLLQHQASTWELVHVLFAAIEGEQQVGGEDLEDDMQGESLYRLAAFKRRAGVSRWLRDQARPAVERALREHVQQGSGSEVAPCLLSLLSGHQLAGAAALAAGTGNVRLATLLAQAGSKSVAKGQLAAQLEVWTEASMDRHIPAPMRQLYALLAGDVDAVVPNLDGLDWRRGFGMHLWYGTPPGASVAEALESYSAAVGDDVAPLPLPLYAEQPSSSGAAGSGRSVSPLGGALDVAFELLRLFAVVSEVGQEEDATLEAALPQLLAQLLRPGGYSPDPLDHSFSWHLLTLLSAIGVVPPEATFPQVFATHMSFVAQLEGAGALAPWAVYVALHLPEAPPGSPWEGVRDKVVRELLVRHCPEWAGDAEVVEFFKGTLRLPRAWLEEAQAQWAQYRMDDAGRLVHLLAAGGWAQAHSLLCSVVAPRWFLSGVAGLRQLEGVLSQLEAHAAAIDAADGPGTWAKGGGVYAAFLYLQSLYSGLLARRDAPCELSFPERMAACRRLAELLQAASEAWGLEGEAGGALQQAAYSCMSERLAAWVVGDRDRSTPSQLLPTGAQSLLAAALPALRQSDVAAGVQLAAVNLAEGIA